MWAKLCLTILFIAIFNIREPLISLISCLHATVTPNGHLKTRVSFWKEMFTSAARYGMLPKSISNHDACTHALKKTVSHFDIESRSYFKMFRKDTYLELFKTWWLSHMNRQDFFPISADVFIMWNVKIMNVCLCTARILFLLTTWIRVLHTSCILYAASCPDDVWLIF